MKTSNGHQARLFKKEIPEMPEDYYSSGPNPNLSKFVEEHATPYDPATDDYDVSPFDKPIHISNRRNPINDLHIYWSKKSYLGILPFIKHYTKPGDLVVDPFCGSGGTAFSALTLKRKMVAIDLSPAATFITKNYSTPVDVDELQEKAALRTKGTLRRIKRFTNAISKSIPPAERDRPENLATLAAWINECRRAGLYDLGKLLYEQGGHFFESLTEEEQLEVQENYLICTRRTKTKDDKMQMNLL